MQSHLFTTLIASLITGTAANCAAANPDSVRCKIDAKDITISDSRADFNHSPSGVKGGSGHVSLFRLLTLNASEGETSSVELKTVDVTAPGDYPLSTESLWRSSIRVQGIDQRVISGRFHFTRFEMKDSRGRAVGTVEFSAGNSSGACTFDVEVRGQNRDRSGL